MSSTKNHGHVSIYILHNEDILESTTLSPIIMEVENYPQWKETIVAGTHFALPWSWEEG